MNNKLISVLACLLLLVGGLAACSSVPPVRPAPTLAVPERPASPTLAIPAPADDDWTRTQAAGVLRVGSPLDNPPFNMYNADFQPDGFEVALMTEIAQRLGLKVEFVDYAFDGLLGALQLKRIDAVIAAMAVTDDRRAVVDFTSSYYQGEDVILAAADSPITAVTVRGDIAQRRVGVQRGTVYERWLLQNMVKTGEMPAASLQTYSQPADAVTALGQGRIDLVIMDREPGLQQVGQGKTKAVGKSLYVQDYAIALRKGSALTPHLNQALAKALADGAVARLVGSYLQLPVDLYTPVPPPPTAEPLPTDAATPAPPPTPAPSPTPAPIDDMAWKADLSYDDAGGPPVVKPGQALQKGWRIENSGTTTWSADFRFAYANGNTPVSNMGGMPVLIGQAVPPGQMIDIYVDLVAPQAPGVYQGFWQMKNAAGKGFGEQVWVKVRVPAPPTPVPPPTAIPAPGISFTADRTQIAAGESAWLRWNVTGVQAVWLCNPPGSGCKDVTGQGQEQVWPQATTTYGLRVQHTDGRTQDVPLTIHVTPSANAPTIVDFNADRSNLHAGECLNLWWRVQGNPSRIAMVRDQKALRDYAMAEEGYTDCPPGSGQIVYELQVWGPGGSGPDKRQVRVMIEDVLPPQTLQLGHEGCGSSHNLRPGDYLIVTLQGEGGTGYTWEQVGGNPSVLTPMGPVNVQQGGGLGTPVIYQWSYQAGGGQTTLTLIWYRPSEGGAPPAETCDITVRVE